MLDFRSGDVVYRNKRGDSGVAAPDELDRRLDIGTTKVCAINGEWNETGQLEIIGVGTTPSRGLRAGSDQH